MPWAIPNPNPFFTDALLWNVNNVVKKKLQTKLIAYPIE